VINIPNHRIDKPSLKMYSMADSSQGCGRLSDDVCPNNVVRSTYSDLLGEGRNTQETKK